MKQKKVIILVCLAIASLIAIIVPAINRGKPEPPAPQIQKGLAITNIGQYSAQLDTGVVGQIEQKLFSRVQGSVQHTAPHYNAEVRAGSFTTQYSSYEGTEPPMQVPTVSFLVDIPAAKRTYAVRFSGGVNYPYKILYVLCPASEQNKYASFPCQDGTQ